MLTTQMKNKIFNRFRNDLLILLIIFTGLIAYASCNNSSPNKVAQFDEEIKYADDSTWQNMATTVNSNQQAVQLLPLSDLLGPLAPIAISPYFGIALTSVASMVQDFSFVQENFPGFANNGFLKTNKYLGQWWVALILIILLMVTSFPNYFKATKTVGVVITYIEDISGLIFVVLMYAVPVYTIVTASPAEQHSNNAEFYSSIYNIFILIVVVINYFVIQTVRYFFELLIFIVPVPFLDAFFEGCKKTICGALYAIYMISPILVLVLNIIIFIIYLLLFNRAKRSLNFHLYVYVKPRINKWFGNTRLLVNTAIENKLKKYFTELKIAIPVYPTTKIGKIKRKKKSWLINDGNDTYLVRFRFLRKPIIEKFININDYKIGKDFFFMRIFAKTDRFRHSIVICNDYLTYYDKICDISKVDDAGLIGARKAANTVKEKVKWAFSTIWRKISSIWRSDVVLE
jgi:hypothetical protein